MSLEGTAAGILAALLFAALALAVGQVGATSSCSTLIIMMRLGSTFYCITGQSCPGNLTLSLVFTPNNT